MSYLLAKKNEHNRDKNIKFREKGHEYTVIWEGNKGGDKTFMSTTTFVHQFINEFNSDEIINNIMNSKNWNSSNKYWGMSVQEIKDLWSKNGKKSAEAGTSLHFDIECVYNGLEVKNNSKEFAMFCRFAQDHKYLEPYRTEWLIYDEDFKITGSVDMVFRDGDVIDIYDWKRCKSIDKTGFNKYLTNPIIDHLPDSKFWHYSLQLNIYCNILERKYGMKVRDLYLIQLHPDNDSYIKIKCANLKNEVQMLLEERQLKNNTI